jgi:hypothetical protein
LFGTVLDRIRDKGNRFHGGVHLQFVHGLERNVLTPA